jgi:Uma2 family endonuclease
LKQVALDNEPGGARGREEAMSSRVLEVDPPVVLTDGEITPEQLLEMPGGDRYELIDGKLVKRDMGAESSLVAAAIIQLLGHFVRGHDLGKVFAPDCGYQIFPDRPKLVRYPDASFIARGRLPWDKVPKGHIRIHPDLAVEVVSPNDTAEEVEGKRVEYLGAGTRVVWIVFPESRTVHVYRQAGPPSVLKASDELTGEDVLPGFTCRVSEFFEGA